MQQLSDRWEFVNRGVGGAAVGQVAQRFDADALNLSPDVIVISAGGNDLIAADFLSPSERRAVIERTSETLERLSRRAATREMQKPGGDVRASLAPGPPPTARLARIGRIWSRS